MAKADDAYFDVFPRIVPADRETKITIRPRHDHCRFEANTTFEVTYFPCEEAAQRSGWPERDKPAMRIVDGDLIVRQYFESEQEHVLEVRAVAGEHLSRVYTFRIYSLREDLFGRRPWKGDLHLHSLRSDGTESPAYVAAACRRAGYDFMAVTDHRNYAASIEAQEAFADVDVDLQIFPGEEVHPPDNPTHIVNFGGTFSVTDLCQQDDAYRAAVKAVEDELDPTPGVDAYQYASCIWVFDKIREANGLGLFCHPYWFTGHRYAPAGALTTKLLDEQPFDALEVISGYRTDEVESNTLQVARYHEERSRGRQLPIVGVSDAHRCEGSDLFGWYYTIVFPPTNSLGDLIGGIKDLRSVAVEALPGENARPYGPFRLVKYARFLMREVFPAHDSLCAEEGRLMLDHDAGDADAAGALARLKGRTARLYDRYWAE